MHAARRQGHALPALERAFWHGLCALSLCRGRGPSRSACARGRDSLRLGRHWKTLAKNGARAALEPRDPAAVHVRAHLCRFEGKAFRIKAGLGLRGGLERLLARFAGRQIRQTRAFKGPKLSRRPLGCAHLCACLPRLPQCTRHPLPHALRHLDWSQAQGPREVRLPGTRKTAGNRPGLRAISATLLPLCAHASGKRDRLLPRLDRWNICARTSFWKRHKG